VAILLPVGDQIGLRATVSFLLEAGIGITSLLWQALLFILGIPVLILATEHITFLNSP